MKFRKTVTALILAALMFVIPVIAAVPVSPALAVIASSQRMTKSASAEAAATFSADDFDSLLGCKVSAITVTALPEATAGRLLFGTTPVMKGQTVSREYLDKLCFLPSDIGPAESSFSFSAETKNGEYRTACTLYVLDGENTAPTSAGLAEPLFDLDVKCNIDAYGSLAAWDAEEDDFSFDIVNAPENGELVLIDAKSGAYRYTPDEDYIGYDSFSYTACDKYGAVSEAITVSVEIGSADLYYSDLGSHWAHSSAIEMTDIGIMDGCVKSGMRFFEAEKTVTRSEFVTAAMKALGHELSDVIGAETVFWDNDDIPDSDIAYVAEAARLGYISGSERDDGRICFYPNESLTRAEAAVMLCKMIGTEQPLYRAVFADETSVPSWAQDAVYTLNSLGLMNGIGNGSIGANEALTRGETAVILDRTMDIAQ